MINKIIESISFALNWVIWRVKNLFLLETDDDRKPETPKNISGTFAAERTTESRKFFPEKRFVGSLRSKRKRYHNPECRYALGLSSEDKIWFENSEKAQEAGYDACGFCVLEE